MRASIGLLGVACLTGMFATPDPAESQLRFMDDFEGDLAGWEVLGGGDVHTADSGDPERGRVLVLRPNGDVHALVRGSERWGPLRIEGQVLFPEDTDNYLGVVYHFATSGERMDFGNVYIKGNGSYLQVNPHWDYNVGRTLYPELSVPLRGDDAIRIGAWHRFRVEVVGSELHFYVGDMSVPKLTFPELQLTGGAVGLQPRSVGGDVWVDDLVVSSIEGFAYHGPPIPSRRYEPASLLTDWQVVGPLERTRDEVARAPAEAEWRPFETDVRGAVVSGRVVDSHGPRSVAYFRARPTVDAAGPWTLHLATIDDLAIWVNGRFHWFVDRAGRAWHDFASAPEHAGQRIPLELRAGSNDIVVRVRGGVYATGGFFAALERGPPPG